jgi:transcriptional regulator with XRE-family HTH domain
MVGKRLKQARKLAGLTQEELAERVHMDSTASRISHYENETHNPPFQLVCKFADVLNVPECWFYCRDDQMAEYILSTFIKHEEFRLKPDEVNKLKLLGDELEKINKIICELINKKTDRLN